MFCSTCGRTYDGPACPACGTNDLDDFAASVQWEPLFEWGDASNSEAKIVGGVGEEWEDPSVVPGARASADGRVSSFLFYVPKNPARMVRSSAVPAILEAHTERPLTPFEEKLLEHIDGARNVRQIAEASGLAPREVVATLIALLDTKIVELRSEGDAPKPAPQRRAGPALLRAPVQERTRGTKPAAESPSKAGFPKISRVPQAQKLFEQAMRDRNEGNILSSQMNLKLALTYDKDNIELKNVLSDLVRVGKPIEKPSADQEATRLFHMAAEEEAKENVDRAIELLEQAIARSAEAPFFNRLGVIVATKKRDLVRARQLIERAIALDPTNKTYRNNLENLED